MSLVKEVFAQFWHRYPALLYGLFAFLGCNLSLHNEICCWISILAIALSCLFHRETWIRLLYAIVLGLSVACFIHLSYQFPNIPSEGISGVAIVDIKNLSCVKKHYGKIWLYRGTLKSFIPEGSSTSIAKSTPISITLPNKEGILRPPATGSFQIKGTLMSSNSFHYVLRVARSDPWHAITGTWSSSEWRYHLKQNLKNYLRHHIENPQVVSFLEGMGTGEFDNPLLTFEFSRFGLQHIMAISGFHFGIVASILSGILRLFFSKKLSTYLLILLISCYFLFLGCSASIMRAWIAIFMALFGGLIEKKSSGINALGVGLLFLTFYDPFMCQGLGFQFSFATTAAILLLYPTCDVFLQNIFAKRSLGQVMTMSYIDQHGYCILSFLRQGLALTLAVNLVAIPITLHYFGKFPLMGLLYNLFFPFLVSFSMFLLLVALPLSFLFPPLANLLHAINNSYTQFLLNFTYHMPPSLDTFLRFTYFSSKECTVIYLLAIFATAIFLKHLLEKRKGEFRDFGFI